MILQLKIWVLLGLFLSVEALSCDGGLFLSQCKYVVNLIPRSSMEKAKPCSTPMVTTTSLTTVEEALFEGSYLNKSVVGGLQYLSSTQPNLAFVIHKVSKFIHKS